jgi:hypothetical protein
MPERFVVYERVSTARQGSSGLGLEVQRRTIDAFAVARGAEVLARFTEVESVRYADRRCLRRFLHSAFPQPPLRSPNTSMGTMLRVRAVLRASIRTGSWRAAIFRSPTL